MPDDVKLRELAESLTPHETKLFLGSCEGWGSWMFEAAEHLCSLGLGTKRGGSIDFDTPLARQLTEYLTRPDPSEEDVEAIAAMAENSETHPPGGAREMVSRQLVRRILAARAAINALKGERE